MPEVIEVSRVYDVPVAEVWSAWTDTDRLARWLGVPSGPLGSERSRLDMGDGDWVDVTVLASDPPKLLRLQWEFVGEVVSELTVRLTPEGAGTRLDLEHRRLGTSATGYGAGWEAYLDVNLARLLGAEPAGTWDEVFAARLPAWRAPA